MSGEGEGLNSTEDQNKTRVYIGTTLENFKTCGSVDEDGRVSYDKTKNTLFETNETMWVYGLNGGYIYAQRLADKLKHTPLVISGEVDNQYYGGEYPKGKSFIVDKVWLPVDNEWKRVNRFSATGLSSEKEMARALQIKKGDPIVILQNESI